MIHFSKNLEYAAVTVAHPTRTGCKTSSLRIHKYLQLYTAGTLEVVRFFMEDAGRVSTLPL